MSLTDQEFHFLGLSNIDDFPLTSVSVSKHNSKEAFVTSNKHQSDFGMFEVPKTVQETKENSFFSSFLNPDFPIDIGIPFLTSQGQSSESKQLIPENSPIMKAARVNDGNKEDPSKKAPTTPRGKRKRNSSKRKRVSSKKDEAGKSKRPKRAILEKELKKVELKKQDRRAKNRKAAQLFRQRQKQHINELEEQVKGVEEIGRGIQNRVDSMTAENALLKNQLKYLRAFIIEALQYSGTNAPVPNAPW